MANLRNFDSIKSEFYICRVEIHELIKHLSSENPNREAFKAKVVKLKVDLSRLWNIIAQSF